VKNTKKGSKRQARAFVARIAKLNNTTQEKVLRYFANLSSGRGVIYHLNLGV